MISRELPCRDRSLVRASQRFWRFARQLHDDQRGTMSIVSVFALIMLATLLGLVINSARQVDHKVKLQNAADSTAYAGGIVMTRSMTTLAFTNHLLCDVFALTAFMREARDRTAESLVDPILDNWERVAPAFIGSEFPPFDQLGQAIQEKVPRERTMIHAYGDWAAAASELMLPVLETMLAEESIPEFQRALTSATPTLAQLAADEMARRHGAAWPRSTELHGVLWRTLVDPVGGVGEQQRGSVPVVDPVLTESLYRSEYLADAREQRRELSHRYLREWEDESLQIFDLWGKMSQYSNLFRTFACGHLEQLLNVEYPDHNLLCQIRTKVSRITDREQHLEQDFMFVGVVYRERLTDRFPRVFRNPLIGTGCAYAQVMMFVPRRRLVLSFPDQMGDPPPIGGVPGETLPPIDPPSSPRPPLDPESAARTMTVRQSSRYHPERWELITQNWTMQLVPATSASIPEILSTQPELYHLPRFVLPDLSSLDGRDFPWLSHH